MKRNVDQAGSARRGRGLKSVAAALALMLGAVPAFAGDRAMLDVIGYSIDARYFAFEQYGIQDGSGFPYSDVFILDLDKDQWVKGAPFSAVVEEDGADPLILLERARAKARAESEPELKSLSIDRPAEIAALIGDGVPEGDGMTLRFGTPFYGGFSSVSGDHVLTLESFEPADKEPCLAETGEAPKGFALSVTNADETRELHRDASIPASRHCPQNYAIHGVFTPYEVGGEGGSAVALISVYSLGFEGPDRRFIAVPIKE